MRQYTRIFRRYSNADYPVDNQLNEFLKQHPDYSVEKFSYSRPNPQLVCEDLFVVFNVEN